MIASMAPRIFAFTHPASSTIFNWSGAWNPWKFSSLSDEIPSIYHISPISNLVCSILPPRGIFALACALRISLQRIFSTCRNVGAVVMTMESLYAYWNARAMRPVMKVLPTQKHDLTATRWYLNTARAILSCSLQCVQPRASSKKMTGSFLI